MNIKVTLGILVALIVLVVAFFSFRSAPVAPAPSQQATSTPASTTTPQAAQGQTKPVIAFDTASSSIHGAFAHFTPASLTSTSTHPLITGTASVSTVSLIINNSAGKGVVGSQGISVVNGRWSYACPVALTPGTYTAILIAGGIEVSAPLVIQ